MWEFQDRPLEISTPKYLALVTTSRIWPCKVYTVLISFLFVATRTTWHLEGFYSMSHQDSHNDSLSRSFWSTVPSSKPPIVRYTAVSSAKSHTCDDSFSGRLFMNARNRIGPKTEPWCTPELTGTDHDSSPSITTVCDLLPRNAQIQDSAFPLIPKWWYFQVNFVKGLREVQQYQISLFACTRISCKVLTQHGKLSITWPFIPEAMLKIIQQVMLVKVLYQIWCHYIIIICSRTLQRIQVREIGL